MHPLFLLPLLMAPQAEAQDVLVPEFTPLIAEDFTLAYMFYSLVIDELRQRDLAFIDGDTLRQVAGSDAEGCGNSITCPSGLWAYFPGTSIALVGTVGLFNAGTAEETIEVRVDFYERDGYTPLKTVERTIAPGQEADFAIALSKATEVLVTRLTAPPEPEPVAAADPEPGPEGHRDALRDRRRRKAEEPEPEPALTPQDDLYKSYYEVDNEEEGRRRKTKEREETEEDPRAERDRKERGHGKVTTRPPRERRERQPREPRDRPAPSGDDHLLRAQAFAGLAIGDVARSYDVRLSLTGQGDGQLGRYEHDTFTGGVGSTFGIGLMAEPTPWLQAGLRLGAISGRKFLSTGYERWSQGDQGVAEIQDYKPAPALRGLIEPRVSVTPIELGPVKPSAHVFFGLRRYDAYAANDLDQLEYPDRNGGWHLVPGAGQGAVYDLGSGRGVSLELNHAVRLGADSVHHVQQGLVTTYPEIPDTSSHTTSILVGFTQGFL